MLGMQRRQLVLLGWQIFPLGYGLVGELLALDLWQRAPEVAECLLVLDKERSL